MKTILPANWGSRANEAISRRTCLPGLVERVRLAREDELDRELRVVDQRGELFENGEDNGKRRGRASRMRLNLAALEGEPDEA